jgi:hypothetical protein
MPANGEQTSLVFLHLAPIAHPYEGAMMAFVMASSKNNIYNPNNIKALCLHFESSSGTMPLSGAVFSISNLLKSKEPRVCVSFGRRA